MFMSFFLAACVEQQNEPSNKTVERINSAFMVELLDATDVYYDEGIQLIMYSKEGEVQTMEKNDGLFHRMGKGNKVEKIDFKKQSFFDWSYKFIAEYSAIGEDNLRAVESYVVEFFPPHLAGKGIVARVDQGSLSVENALHKQLAREELPFAKHVIVDEKAEIVCHYGDDARFFKCLPLTPSKGIIPAHAEYRSVLGIYNEHYTVTANGIQIKRIPQSQKEVCFRESVKPAILKGTHLPNEYKLRKIVSEPYSYAHISNMAISFKALEYIRSAERMKWERELLKKVLDIDGHLYLVRKKREIYANKEEDKCVSI